MRRTVNQAYSAGHMGLQGVLPGPEAAGFDRWAKGIDDFANQRRSLVVNVTTDGTAVATKIYQSDAPPPFSARVMYATVLGLKTDGTQTWVVAPYAISQRGSGLATITAGLTWHAPTGAGVFVSFSGTALGEPYLIVNDLGTASIHWTAWIQELELRK